MPLAILASWTPISATPTGNRQPDHHPGFQMLERFTTEHSYTRIGIASHGGVIRRMMQQILAPGSPAVPIPNGVLDQLRYESDLKRLVRPKRHQN